MRFLSSVVLLVLLTGPVLRADTGFMGRMLGRTGKTVSTFLDQFGSVTCTEEVSQEKLKSGGKREYAEQSRFDLLVMISSDGGELKVDESRHVKAEGKHQDKLPLMVTNGFSTLLLVFHPHFQNDFRFRIVGEGVVENRAAIKVAFEHIRGTATPAALVLRGREFPLDWVGTAWIDKESAAVLRITAELGSSMEDVGIRNIKSDVLYTPVHLAGNNYLLPSVAVIDLETPRQHWRNTHKFNQYKRFSVSTSITVPDYE